MERLIICRTMAELDFEKLMQIYEESCLERGRELSPFAAESVQRQIGEDCFQDYLRRDFFTRKGAAYMMLLQDGAPVSALRLEPWEDGLLLEALETAPSHRGHGFASSLIRRAQESFPQKFYSHVSRRNRASLAVHTGCGFRLLRDHARLLDGTVTTSSVTLLWSPEERKNNA